MPRAKQKTGTTKTGVIQRRARNQKTERLIALARRFGAVFGAVVFALWLGAWVVLSGGLARGAEWTQQQLYEAAARAGFAVDNVLVEGRVNADPDVLRALINVQRGDPIFAFNPDEAKDMLERVSWIKTARVERRLPGTIYIGLTERQPMALWQNKGKVRVIDSEGVTLTDRNLEPFRDLIILVGEGAPKRAPAMLELLAAEPAVREKVEAASWVGDRRWDLELKNGITVKLPENDLGLALRKLADAQGGDGLLDKDLTAIDLREPGRIIVRTRPGAVQEYQASLKGSSI